MNTLTVSQRRTRVLTLLGTTFLAIVLGLSAPLQAQAHDRLVETNPAADAQLDEAPAEIELIYSNTLIEIGNIVEVINAQGQNIAQQEVTVSGPKLVQSLPAESPVGWYLVNWRAVSSDGHPITGSFYYLVGDDTSLPKPAEDPEFVDDHHDGTKSEKRWQKKDPI